MINPEWCANFNMVGHYMFSEGITNRRKTLRVWDNDTTRLSTVYYVTLPYELHIAGNTYPVVLFHYNAWLPRPENRILLSRDALRQRVMNLVRRYTSIVSHEVVNPEDNDSDDEGDNRTFANMLPAPSTPPRRYSSSSDDSHRSVMTLAPTAESQSIEPLDRLASVAVQQLEERVVTEALPIPEFVGRLLITNARQGSESCPISTVPYGEIQSLSATSCFHVFETESLQRWLRENRTCPVCRIHVRNMVTHTS